MKRAAALLAVSGIAIASLLLAQSPNQVTLRIPSGDRQITIVEQPPHVLVAADELIAALGGSLVRDSRGFRMMIGNVEAAFGADSRFGVVGESLVEMPIPATITDTRPFVPWQFFQQFLNASGRDLTWDPAARVLEIKPLQRQIVHATVSVVDLEDLTKIVFELSARADYTMRRETDAFLFQFRQPVKGPFGERSYQSPSVRAIVFQGNELRVQLTSAEVAGDAYRLDNPARIVLDLRAGVGLGEPGRQQAPRPLRAVDLPGVRTIVLDPGHGGKAVGAVGANGLMEKETTLAICRKLASLLGTNLGTRVILTRNDDSLIPLEQRTAIANQYRADLFLSIHLNASAVRDAHGSETYFLSVEASDEFAKRAAERENEAPESASAPVIASSDLRLILWDLAQQQYLKESSRFAELVQEEMNVVTGVTGRGVKQAPFKVLVGAMMPAALVEVGFISNPSEESKLRDEQFQTTIANALLKAIGRYKSEVDAKSGSGTPAPAGSATVPEPTLSKPHPTPASEE